MSATIILAIGYLLASDVQARARASVATINARAAIATAMLTRTPSAARTDHPSSRESVKDGAGKQVPSGDGHQVIVFGVSPDL
ncbi:hypothetical protein SAMN04515671_3441 [Nakamurella panacisegetis]|uniref:Uncharacterized protein n=1 Tax=Nakamurella panacisegetis TaxID=1090615 RepID=A0A1H0R854_9ACTN|nr:hypothetical protein [Nakamurella panacisegetis]SDP25661.1 hypothetical protein SAMN04515671_3441 [Nakamurella panacisegetis]